MVYTVRSPSITLPECSQIVIKYKICVNYFPNEELNVEMVQKIVKPSIVF